MKIVVSSTALAGAVKNLCHVINQKNALLILGDILCDVNEQDKSITLTASDSETWLRQTLALKEAEGGGKFCVDATLLMEAVGELTEQPVTILATTESDNQFRLQHSTGEAYFPLEPADEYPTPEEPQDPDTLWMNVKQVTEALNATRWATSDNDLRPAMTGVYFNFTDTHADIVASGGHVLMRYRIEEDCEQTGAFIMPKKVAKLLPAMLATEDRDDDVQMVWTERTAQVEGTLWTLTFRLIEGRYLNYESVIPKDSPYRADLTRGTLVSAVRKVSPFASDSSQLLRLTFEREQLTLTGEDYDFSTGATDRIYADSNVTDPLTIGLKASSLAAMLRKLPYGELRLNLRGPKYAVTLEEKPEEGKESKTQGSLLGLIMPMLVQGDD